MTPPSAADRQRHGIVSPNIRVRYPDDFKIGPYSIVDDFSYFSTRVEVGLCSHLAPCVSVIGGPTLLFRMGDFCTLATGARVVCGSDDFVRSLGTTIPPEFAHEGAAVVAGDCVWSNYVTVGANSVLLGPQSIPEGVIVGALSFVPPGFAFEPWGVYVGIPVRKMLKHRDRDRVMREVDHVRRRIAEFEASRA